MAYNSKIHTFLRKYILSLTLPICLFSVPICQADLITWKTPEGDLSTLQINPEDSFISVITQIRDLIDSKMTFIESDALQADFFIDFSTVFTSPSSAVSKSKGIGREYTPLTTSERKDIAFIVTTLGNASLTSIASAKSSLKKAGDRIEGVHPMQFLLYVFTEEKLKAAMHNLQGRTSWIKNEFFNGIIRSFDEETARNNVNGFIEDFSKQLNLDYALLYPLIIESRWKDLINTLYTQIPRSGDTDRYDM